ncbi:MAG: hypothetical protein HYX34_07845 [Actinobacteria bacterium]|nr:hypothetical protein [Actinomycetota bacterium]
MKPIAVWDLGVMSQEFQDGPRISQPFADLLIIGIDHELEDGSYAWQELRFTGVVGYLFTFAWSVVREVSFGTLDMVSIYDPRNWPLPVDDVDGLLHYVTFFDDFGCFEVLAREFVPPASARLVDG